MADTKFPRVMKSDVQGLGHSGSQSAQALPQSEDFAFDVSEEVITSDIEVLQGIDDAFGQKRRIMMDVQRAVVYHENRELMLTGSEGQLGRFGTNAG